MPTLAENGTRLRSSLDFEVLIAELLSRFVELPAGDIDAAIGTAQRRVCEILDLDVSSLWQWTPGSQRYFTVTHLYRPTGGPPLPERTDAEEMFPWCLRELLAGRSYHFTSAEEFPPEAARDREMNLQLGLRSFATMPLSTGGGPVLGALNFATTKEERVWSPDVLRRLQLVGQIFAGALGRKAADEALRESEERLQLAAESAGVGLWSLDLATSAYWLTDQARRSFAFSTDEPVTLERVLGAVVPEDRGRIGEAVEAACAGPGEVIVEYRILAPSGEERWLSSRGRARRSPSGEPESVMGVTLDVTGRKRAEAALRDLSQSLIRAHEEERALLARELHDDLTQRLAILAIEVGRTELAFPDGPLAGTLREVREGLVSLSEDVHSLASQLHPSVLEELGLAEALRTECERFRRQTRADLTADLAPQGVAVGPAASLSLFRVAQEALRNVERHAEASAVSLALRPRGDGLLLTVRDDGVGFDPEVQRERRSLGLASMRERLEIVGGTLRIESAPGAGAAVVAWVPAGGVSG